MDIVLKKELIERIRPVRLLVLDVDGVMTDGGIIYDDKGREIKSFDVRDGHGIKLLMRYGIEVAIVTARESRVVNHRAENLGIGLVFQGMKDKIKALDEILKKKPFSLSEIAYIGDDLVDLPVIKRVGFSAAVADAVPEVRERVHYVTKAPGGRGAVREVAELILKVQGRWEEVLKHYLS